jgi:DNA-binding winged helix-turn-helix (wHTH) protein
MGQAIDKVSCQFDEFRFDPATGELTRGGDRIGLQNQPSRILEVLTSRPGELVTRSELHELIWGTTTFVDHDQGLNYCIRQIRRALGDRAEKPRYVETLPRRGYRFLPAVEVVSSPRSTRGAHSPWLRLLPRVSLLLAGLMLGALLDHEAVASGAHDQMTIWIHSRLGVTEVDCPLAR